MKGRLEDRLSMALAAQQVLNDNASLWNSISAMVTEFSNLGTKIAEIEGARGIQEQDMKGVAIDKKEKKRKAIEAALPVIGSLKAFAIASEDNTLLKKIDYTRAQMETILVGKLIATSARQIGMFLVILAVVSAAIVAFIIYTLTLGKVREIAVLKLIGTRNRTIAFMILQQAVGLGVLGFVVGKISATFWAPIFPKYVLLEPGDAARGFAAVVVICVLASVLAIRAALKVDPAEAIGG